MLQQPRQRSERVIALFVSQRVVVYLEIIHIYHMQTKISLFAVGATYLNVEQVIEISVVIKLGQAIGKRELPVIFPLLRLLLELLAFNRAVGNNPYVVGIAGFCDKIESAELHRFYGNVH